MRFSPLNAPSPLQLNMHRHLWACLATLALVASACAIGRAAVHDHPKRYSCQKSGMHTP